MFRGITDDIEDREDFEDREHREDCKDLKDGDREGVEGLQMPADTIDAISLDIGIRGEDLELSSLAVTSTSLTSTRSKKSGGRATSALHNRVVSDSTSLSPSSATTTELGRDLSEARFGLIKTHIPAEHAQNKMKPTPIPTKCVDSNGASASLLNSIRRITMRTML
jgi:hypothetical protein